MVSFTVKMSKVTFAIVNVPVSVATILVNMFFVYCMISSQEGPVNRVKPPLNVLLWSLIGCNLILNIFNLLFSFFNFVYPAPWIYVFSVAGFLFAMWTGFTASFALNVCYYLQIVPVRQTVLIWIKKHIRLFVYLALFVDRLLFLPEFLGRCILYISAMNLNSTRDHVNNTSEKTNSGFYVLSHIYFWIRCCYFLLCLGIMLASSSVTVVYLRTHIKRMEENNNFFSAVRKKQQMKVTIISIIQGVLYFLAAGWLMIRELYAYFAVDFWDRRGHLIFTVMALYSLGATILLGIGQTKFRLMAKNVGRKLQTLKCPLS
ncbi:uncharacterized protein [Garra rufa]|uniref:uncharacterized protein n=1 Tax=Garra rufa TaxID=137080 RepID=UPI003CCEBFB7